MAKQKKETVQPPEAPATVVTIPQNDLDKAAYGRLDNIFHIHEDNWNNLQDEVLLNLILSENGVSDLQRIKYLLKKYRDTQRFYNNC